MRFKGSALAARLEAPGSARATLAHSTRLPVLGSGRPEEALTRHAHLIRAAGQRDILETRKPVSGDLVRNTWIGSRGKQTNSP
jgi:hypothetical protein